MSERPLILIAGGGIGGLTAALSLIRRGFAVRVFEQAPELREVGAGLHVTPNAMAVFADLDLTDRIMLSAVEPNRRVTRLWSTGQEWSLGPFARTTYGNPFVSMYRPDLLDVLATAVRACDPQAIQLGRKIVDLREDTNKVTLRFSNGDEVSGDVLIGADGVHSVVRQKIHGEDRAEFTGLAVWRAAVPIDRLPPHLRKPTTTAWMGPGRHIVHYLIRGGELMNFGGVVEKDDWRGESWMSVGDRAEMLKDFAGWHDDAQVLLNAIEQPNIWALKLRPPLPRWRTRRVTLLGDACHPTLPFMAQGAAMAIEDGLVFGRALEAHGVCEDALAAYEAARLDRTTRIINGSASNTGRFHNSELAEPESAVQFMDREFGQSGHQDRMNWVYEYDARQVAV